MIDLIQEAHAQLKNPAENEVTLRNNLVRAIMIKDEHAELVKQEVRVIWGDYFKAEIKANFPDLDGLVHEIMQLASKTKQTAERDSALRLLDKVNRFAEIFWDSKGKQTKRAKAPYKPEEEIVYPVI
jgi:nickel superoxide dismutase